MERFHIVLVLPFLHFDQTLVRVSFSDLKNLELEFMFIQIVFNMQFQNWMQKWYVYVCNSVQLNKLKGQRRVDSAMQNLLLARQ